jgi:hypothetical protein
MSHPRRDRSWFSLRLYMVDVEELGLEPDLCFKLRDIGVNTVEQARKRDLALICRGWSRYFKTMNKVLSANFW